MAWVERVALLEVLSKNGDSEKYGRTRGCQIDTFQNSLSRLTSVSLYTAHLLGYLRGGEYDLVQWGIVGARHGMW